MNIDELQDNVKMARARKALSLLEFRSKPGTSVFKINLTFGNLELERLFLLSMGVDYVENQVITAIEDEEYDTAERYIDILKQKYEQEIQ